MRETSPPPANSNPETDEVVVPLAAVVSRLTSTLLALTLIPSPAPTFKVTVLEVPPPVNPAPALTLLIFPEPPPIEIPGANLLAVTELSAISLVFTSPSTIWEEKTELAGKSILETFMVLKVAVSPLIELIVVLLVTSTVPLTDKLPSSSR